jgi:hypothetical protein
VGIGMRIKQVPFNEVVHNTTTKLGNHSRNEYFGGFGTHVCPKWLINFEDSLLKNKISWFLFSNLSLKNNL